MVTVGKGRSTLSYNQHNLAFRLKISALINNWRALREEIMPFAAIRFRAALTNNWRALREEIMPFTAISFALLSQTIGVLLEKK